MLAHPPFSEACKCAANLPTTVQWSRPPLWRAQRLCFARSGRDAHPYDLSCREVVSTASSTVRSRPASFAQEPGTQGWALLRLQRCGVPGSGYHSRGALSSWRFGRYIHTRRPHRLSVPPRWTDAVLSARPPLTDELPAHNAIGGLAHFDRAAFPPSRFISTCLDCCNVV
jgi:hypothetical protein